MATEQLPTILEALAKHKGDEELVALGKSMFNMYTQDGFPPDMFLSEIRKRMELSKSAQIFVLSEYQTRFLEHRRKSGVQDKNLDKIRRLNREVMERFIKTGETGVY